MRKITRFFLLVCSLFLGLSLQAQTVFSATGLPQTVGPNSGTVTTSVISATSANFSISDINVTLNVDHSWMSDMDIYLKSPNGTVVELTTGNGSSSDGYINTVFDDAAGTAITGGSYPFTGTYSPEGSLADFNGEESYGDWTLTITDQANGDGGNLNSWSIEVTGAEIHYGLYTANTAVETCEPNDAVYNFTYHTFGGFSENVTYTASGLPTGATATFSPATVSADGTAVTMTVSGLNSSNVGTYAVSADGTSDGTSIV